MTKPVRTEPEAVEELHEAARWYEKRRRGLGLEFLAAIGALTSSNSTRRVAAWCRASRTKCPPGDWSCDDFPIRSCSSNSGMRFESWPSHIITDVQATGGAGCDKSPGPWPN